MYYIMETCQGFNGQFQRPYKNIHGAVVRFPDKQQAQTYADMRERSNDGNTISAEVLALENTNS